MQIIKTNKLAITAVFFIVAVVFWLFVHKPSVFISQSNTDINQAKSVFSNNGFNNAIDSLAKPVETTKLDTIASNNFPEIYNLTPEEEADAVAWLAAHGERRSSNNEYAGYDIETLKTLVKNGDLQAVDALGNAYLMSFGRDAADQFYMDMAARGLTHIFHSIGLNVSVFDYKNAQTTEEKSAAAIEVLALYNVAKLRGDRWINITMANSFVRMNNIQLSTDDKQKIELRSQEIYNQLQAKRTELGLGDFDNSVPQAVNKYFDRFEYLQSLSN
jgi:hypothetical protein